MGGLSLSGMTGTFRGRKRVFKKHKQFQYENGKEIYTLFQNESLGRKKAPAATARPTKKKRKHEQSPYNGAGQRALKNGLS